MKKISNILVVYLLVVFILSPFGELVSAKNLNVFNKKINQEKINTNSKKPTPTQNVLDESNEYNFEVKSLDLSGIYAINKELNPSIILKNTSGLNWSKQEVKIGYHWIDENNEYEIFRGDDTSLVKDIKAGQTGESQNIKIKTPEIPGNFKLSIDLIKNNEWFTTNTSYRFEKSITITGNLEIKSYESQMLLNDGETYANNVNLKATVIPYTNQPQSESASFIFDFVQFTDSSEEKILNGTANWSSWKLLSNPWDKSNVNFTIKDQSVGVKKIFMRYRAIKKHSDATPSSYGDAMYQYGRSSKTTGVYYVDEIFFDNVPPIGGVTINNGEVSTSSRYGSLQIWATDEVKGVMGSGLSGMRIAANCDINNLDSNSWSEWESQISNKTNYYLGTGNVMVVCVQIKDNAENIATFSDSINLIQITSGGNSGGVFGVSVGYGIGTAEDKFAGKTSSDLRKPWIEFDRFIDIFGVSKWNNVKHWDMPEPIITYVNRIDKTTVEVSGIAIRKWNPADVIVNNQYRYCFLCGDGWEWFKEERAIEHVKVQILKEDGTVLKEIWNDDSLGRWQTNLTIGSNLAETEKIYAKVLTYGKHYFNNLKWWNSTTESNVEFIAWDLWSGHSTHMNMPKYIELLTAEIKNNYSFEVVNGAVTWKGSELETVLGILKTLPKEYWNHGFIDALRREGNHPVALAEYDYISTNDIIFYDGSFNTGTLGFNIYGYSQRDQLFKHMLVHEMAHAWEEYDKVTNGAKTLSDFSDLSWNRDNSKIYEQWTRDPNAQLTTINKVNQTRTIKDFVSDYATTKSFEDWAESVPVLFYLKDRFNEGTQILKNKEGYADKAI